MPAKANATEVRETIEDSIEAKGTAKRAGTDDVEMKDRADEEADAEGEADGEGELDAEGEDEAPERDLLQTIQDLATFLCAYKEEGEEDELAVGFQRIPNRRALPHYFEVIPNPIAFSTIRQKIMRKQYTAFPEFVRDVAQICHNAQVFNRPSAGIFGAAVRLRELFQQELQKLVDQGVITESEAELPDLGELPSADESPPPEEEEEEDEEEEDEEEEEEDEEDDDDDDEEGGRRRRRRSRASRRRDSGTEGKKRRGRPPRVLTPMEARILSVIKGLRKPKDSDGDLLIYPFEKLPDKQANPDYYDVITQPMALDNIKKKAKRKKYRNVDHVLADINTMFENAKLYNEDGSDLFEAAVELQKFAKELAAQEKEKPDDSFRDDEGKLPLSEIQANGETWRVGDWVHIRNANDLSKPIIAQIYRTWQDPTGQKWINACWYYRPEQTVHRAEKHFFEREVVKTGQYRDHRVEEIVDRCFVMFVTRFNKGRPQGLPRDKAVYVCESRYNEEKFTFNKIKTWASCLPDEVREKDYVMDLYSMPLRMKKVPSPIKHLLRDDAKPTDELPKPTWGNASAPPIVGAVHRRPREPNESPPPEPTPPPTPAPPAQARSIPRPPPHAAPRGIPHIAGPTHNPLSGYPMAAPPVGGASQSPAPHYYTPGHFQPSTPHTAHAATPSPILRHNQVASPAPVPYQHHQPPVAIRPMHHPQQQHPQAAAYHPQQYQAYAGTPIQQGHFQPMHAPMHQGYQVPTPSRAPMAPTPGNAMPQQNAYNPPRPVEVYTLSDAANEAIPEDVRKVYHRDEQGRVLFFTAPSSEHHELGKESAGLAHSAKYLDGLDEWRKEREEKRRARDEARDEEVRKRKAAEEESEKKREEAAVERAAGLLTGYFEAHEATTKRIRVDMGLENVST